MGCKIKGRINKGGKGKRGGEKIYIRIKGDDTIYFVSIKTLEGLLQGTRKTINIRGYD